MISGFLHGAKAGYPWLLNRAKSVGNQIGARYVTRRDKLIEVLAEDLREIGILTVVFLILDNLSPDKKPDPAAFHQLLKYGIVSFVLGYVVEMVRK